MKQFYRITLSLAALFVSLMAAAVQPERPTCQSHQYDATAGTLTFTVKMPTTTVYDEYYIMYDLDHINQFIIERRFQGGSYDSFAVVASVDNPGVGATVEAVDNTVQPGMAYEYKFSVIVDNEKGQSDYLQFFSAAVPAVITDFAATSEGGATPSVTLTLTAPSTDTAGNPLESLTKVVIEKSLGMFQTETVTEFTPVTPGQALSYTDTNVETGKIYYYRAYSYNGDNCRSELTPNLQILVGEDVPAAPANFTATVTGENQVTLTWEAPTEGYYGGVMNADNVEYGIYRKFWDDDYYYLVAQGITGTEYVDNTNLPEESLVRYCIMAVNETGECPIQPESEEILVGVPAAFPFTESFPYMELEHKGWTRSSTYYDEYYMPTFWTLHEGKSMFYWPADDYLYIEPVDGDNGMAVAYFYVYQEPGTVHSLTSPRISMTNAENPRLIFSYFETCREATENQVRVLVKANDDTEWTQVYESTVLDEVDPNWHQVLVDLPQYAGKDWINIRFDAVRGGNMIVDLCLDGISLTENKTESLTGIETDTDESIQAVYGIDGKLILSTPSDAAIRDLAPGIYLLKSATKTIKIAR